MKQHLPIWFKKKIPNSRSINITKDLISKLNLNTICDNAICPNRGDCFSKKTATFLILGNVCTRNCTFCAVKKGTPVSIDEDEPARLADAVTGMGLRHVVITSVTRDDLPDGGAEHFSNCISMLKARNHNVTVEVLIPDFNGSPDSLKMVLSANPDVINHNIETVPGLYPKVRPMAYYRRSLELLRRAKDLNPLVITKSGIMVGLGETVEELKAAMEDLREARCDLLTIGQYLQPSPKHHPVVRYVSPEEFNEYALVGKAMGFAAVASAPLVRSSFNAAELFDQTKLCLATFQNDQV